MATTDDPDLIAWNVHQRLKAYQYRADGKPVADWRLSGVGSVSGVGGQPTADRRLRHRRKPACHRRILRYPAIAVPGTTLQAAQHNRNGVLLAPASANLHAYWRIGHSTPHRAATCLPC